MRQMPRIARRFTRTTFVGTVGHQSRGAVHQVRAAALSVTAGATGFLVTSLGPAVGQVIGAQPRYVLHGMVVAVGLVAVGLVALQPDHTTAPAATEQPVTLQQPSLAAEPEPLVANLEPPAVAVAPTAQPQPTPAPTKAPKPIVHTVGEGETLRLLAEKYGVSYETLVAANAELVANPDLVTVGQELVVLPTNGVLHRVRSGETLRNIAERYEVEMAAIVGANDLGPNPDLVVEGSELVIPGAVPVVRAPGEQNAATIGGGVGLSAPEAQRRVVPTTRSYEVQEGDTLRSIAETFGVDVATVLSSNGISDPDTIRPGIELRILPVKGVEYTIQPGETLADVAWKYQVDLGLLLDYNDLDNPDVIRVDQKLVVPGGRPRPEAVVAPAPAPAVRAQVGPASVAAPAAPAAPAPAPARPAAVAPRPAPQTVTGSGGGTIVANAMKFRGYPYVFGGTSPGGFDCSGFVYYVHRVSGSPVGRGMWQQLNGGPRISRDELLPGDTVFFANTYMPGLSHNGIYVGGGQFIHASDPGTGVVVSSMGSSYWASRYVGAARLWD